MIGVDDAGRGVLIGPMVVAGVKAGEEAAERMKKAGVRDSKKFSESRIKKLAAVVRGEAEDFAIKSFSAERLDKRDKKLDDFEREAIDSIVEELGGGEAIADFVSKPELVKRAKVVKRGERFTQVAAASILASEHYFRKMEKIRAEYGEVGSGNPNDPVTMGWLKDWWKREHSWPPVVRTFYKTIGRIEESSL